MSQRTALKTEEAPSPNKAVNILHVMRAPTRSQIKRVEWDVSVPPETTVEDILNPVFWANVSESTFKQSPYNKISVHWDDGKQYAELYVRQAGHSFAVVGLLGHWTFTSQNNITDVSKYSVSYTGHITKYRVIRKEDNQHIKDGFPSEDAAYDYIKNLDKQY